MKCVKLQLLLCLAFIMPLVLYLLFRYSLVSDLLGSLINFVCKHHSAEWIGERYDLLFTVNIVWNEINEAIIIVVFLFF